MFSSCGFCWVSIVEGVVIGIVVAGILAYVDWRKDQQKRRRELQHLANAIDATEKTMYFLSREEEEGLRYREFEDAPTVEDQWQAAFCMQFYQVMFYIMNNPQSFMTDNERLQVYTAFHTLLATRGARHYLHFNREQEFTPKEGYYEKLFGELRKIIGVVKKS